MCDLTNPIFHNENKARKFLEAQRWPDGVSCPFCGALDTSKPFAMTSKTGKAVKGWYRCTPCRKKFTLRVGTLYERSHIPLHKWLLATHLMCSSKKGISAHQLHRSLGITYKSAWFMCHRIREGMRDSKPGPMGGGGKVVEADETYIGNRTNNKRKFEFKNDQGWVRRGGGQNQYKVVSLVERDGIARSVHVKSITANAVRDILVANADRKSKLMTDESNVYTKVGKEFDTHETVNHSEKEYGRGPVHTNTIEGFFSIFKRGMRGIYQHCGEQHLQRYLSEFDFRHNQRVALGVNDVARAGRILDGVVGKRLTYETALTR